jgi:hypothetical protein
MNVARSALVLTPLFLVASYAGCSSSTPSTGPNPAYADVIFQGAATQGALTSLLAVKAADDPALAAYFDNPMDLSENPPSPILTFTWHDGQAAAMRLLPPSAPKATFVGVLSDLLGERSAHAEGPTMTGPGYLLAFSTLETNQELFRVFTSTKSFTPDAASWAKVATGNWTVLQITSATFAGDAVATNGGPYGGQVIKFCIGAWQQ